MPFSLPGCVSYVKVEAQTGSVYGGGQTPYYGANPELVLSINNVQHSAPLSGRKEYGSNIVRELSLSQFSPWISGCVTQKTIDQVFLKAAGTDGWYVSSIKTYTASSDKVYSSLSKDLNLNKWVDFDEEDKYAYDAKLVPLTLDRPQQPTEQDCLTQFKISAQTGSLQGAGFSSTYMNGQTHHVVLMLRDGKLLQADLPSPAYHNWPYNHELSFVNAFKTGGICVKQSDIVQVKLKAGGNDGWYTTSISTFVKTGKESYQELTNDSPFNKWLDGDEEHLYSYNAKEQILSMKSDTPECGYGIPVCECKESAQTCVLNLEIDEIMTFTSYQKFKVGLSEGLAVRGTQGVIYNIDEETGNAVPHPIYKGRKCGENWSSEECTDPQFVDGKTYRMAVGVNGQIPGPTLIVHDGQTVVIHVNNNMSTEGM